jgi:hypothetical protein
MDNKQTIVVTPGATATIPVNNIATDVEVGRKENFSKKQANPIQLSIIRHRLIGVADVQHGERRRRDRCQLWVVQDDLSLAL